jgi:hypothetical protein
VHEGDGQGDDEDVEHRPTPDKLDDPIEPRPLERAPGGAAV